MAASKNRKLVSLSLEQRISVIRESEKGKSQRQLASEFNCGKSQIQNTIANRVRYVKEWEENANKNSKKRRWQPFEDVNNAVLEWFNRARAKGLPISGPMVQEKALKFASDLGIPNFNASNGWLDRFRVRHGIVFRAVCGESAEVNQDVVSDWKSRLSVITSGYCDSDIYNMDETGLFFKAIPDKTLTVKGDQCKGGKMAKQRLTIGLCASLCGEKEEPLVIHTANRPRCFKNNDISLLGVSWHANKNAWMTCDIFRSWLNKLNSKMSIQKRKILLFIDNAPCHCSEKLSNVEVKFFPANTTSCVQPLDQGVIRSFKLNYRKKLLRSLVAKMDNATSVYDLAKSVTVSDAVSWIKSAWNEVKPETITKCFINSGFQSSQNEDAAEDEGGDESINDLSQLCEAANIELDISTMNEQIECFNSGDNWEDVVAEMNPDPQCSDNQNSDSEDDTIPVEAIPLDNALHSIARHKSLASELSNQKLMYLLSEVEKEYEHVIVNKRMKKCVQMPISAYFST